MTDLEKSLIGASLINTIFMEYKQGELTNAGELVRKRIGKFMRQRGKTNRKICLSAIKKTDKAWRETINHFAKKELKIEAKSTIAAIYNYLPKEMEKFANIQDKHIEQFMILATDNFEAEKNSSTVVDYLMKEIGVEKKKSLFSGKKLTLKNNLIIEGNKIASGF